MNVARAFKDSEPMSQNLKSRHYRVARLGSPASYSEFRVLFPTAQDGDIFYEEGGRALRRPGLWNVAGVLPAGGGAHLGDGKERPGQPGPALSNLRAAGDSCDRSWPTRLAPLFKAGVLPRLPRCPQPRGPSSPSWALPSKGRAMPSPGPRDCRPLPLSGGAGIQPQRSSRSPGPASPALPPGSANPGPPRAPGRLASSFSVEAILARPDPRAPTTSPLSVSAGAHGGLWNVPSRPPAQALPGACPPTRLPACLSAGLHQPCPQPPALRPLASHFCGLQGLSVTGTRERTAATVGTG